MAFDVGAVRVGSGDPVIIAEAGVNHNGSQKLARELIQVAAEAGADLIKFQTFAADRLVTGSAKKADYQLVTTEAQESQHEMIRKLELSREVHEELIEYCQQCGIGFFSTGFDIQSVSLLAGTKWTHGSLVAAFEYSQRDPIFDRDRWFTSEEARDYGLIDHVYSTAADAPGSDK